MNTEKKETLKIQIETPESILKKQWYRRKEKEYKSKLLTLLKIPFKNLL